MGGRRKRQFCQYVQSAVGARASPAPLFRSQSLKRQNCAGRSLQTSPHNPHKDAQKGQKPRCFFYSPAVPSIPSYQHPSRAPRRCVHKHTNNQEADKKKKQKKLLQVEDRISDTADYGTHHTITSVWSRTKQGRDLHQRGSPPQRHTLHTFIPRDRQTQTDTGPSRHANPPRASGD